MGRIRGGRKTYVRGLRNSKIGVARRNQSSQRAVKRKGLEAKKKKREGPGKQQWLDERAIWDQNLLA